MKDEFLVVLSTAASREEGERIAGALVAESLAACVNIIGDCRSVYRWEGDIVTDDEVLLAIKTSRAKFPALEQRIISLHSYDVPEVVGLLVSDISEGYRRFLQENLGD